MKTHLFILLLFTLMPAVNSWGAVRGAQTEEGLKTPDADKRKAGLGVYEISAGAGYAAGKLKGTADNEFEILPLFVHFGLKLNSLINMDPRLGALQVAVEPFLNTIVSPDNGIEAGFGVFFKYTSPQIKKVSLYIELGSGPEYFGIDTLQQGEAGFNFLNQGGGGLYYFFDDDKAVFAGYRYRHASHAGIRDSINGGINAHSVIAGLSLFY